MNSRGTRALVLATLGLAAGAAWLGWRLATSEPPDASAGVAPEIAPDAPRPRAVAEVDPPADEPAAARSDVAAPAAVDDAPATENFDLADARWIEVEVHLPFGTPDDEELAVLVASTTAGGALEGPEARLLEAFARRRWSASRLEREGVRWARRAVADGRARLPVPPRDHALLALEGRYLYLEERVPWRGQPHVVLEPLLGACVSGRCLLPPGATGRGIETVAGSALAHDADGGIGGLLVPWATAEIEDGAFELRALPADTRYLVIADARGLTRYRSEPLDLRPGEHRRLDAPLGLGTRVRGHVVGDGGAPVAGARVAPTEELSWQPHDEEDAAVTDDDGAFTLDGLPPGKLQLTATAEGWLDTTHALGEVAEGAVLEGVELRLRSGERIAGTVAWPDGRPAVGAGVRALAGRTLDEWRRPRRVAETTSDAQGRFVLGGLDLDGSLSVVATLAPQSAPDAPAWSAARDEVAPGVDGLELVLERPVGLAGRIRSEHGTRPAAFEVVAEPADGGEEGVRHERFDSADGTFRLEGLQPDRWKLVAEAEGFESGDAVEVEIVEGREPSPVELRLEPPARVRGHVVGPAGAPVPGATVGVPNRGAKWMPLVRSTSTDAEGRFELSGVPTPEATLVARHADWAESEPFQTRLEPGAEQEGVQLVLRTGGRITGEVRDQDGRPAAGRVVTASENGFAFGPFGGASTRTDAAGGFALEHVAPGAWMVSAAPPAEELLARVEENEDNPFLAILGATLSQRVEVADGESVHVVLGAEPPDPVTVRGRVTRAGEPVPDVELWILPEGSAMLQGAERASTDDRGRFEVELDRPGAYVFTVAAGEGCQETFPEDVSGPSTDLELALPGGRVSGAVTDAEGAPVSEAWLRLRPGAGAAVAGQLGPGAFTGADREGRFAFSCVAPGPWEVVCSGPGFATTVRSLEMDGAAARTVDFVVAPAGQVQGVVLGLDGEPAEDAVVSVRDLEGRVLAAHVTTTGAEGSFGQLALPLGPVLVSARTASLASPETPARATKDGDERVEVRLQPATVLRVVLLEGDDPVSLGLSCLDAQGREHAGGQSPAQRRDDMLNGFTTREQVVGPLPPGTYRVRAEDPDGRSAEAEVTLAGEPEKRLELRLAD